MHSKNGKLTFSDHTSPSALTIKPYKNLRAKKNHQNDRQGGWSTCHSTTVPSNTLMVMTIALLMHCQDYLTLLTTCPILLQVCLKWNRTHRSFVTSRTDTKRTPSWCKALVVDLARGVVDHKLDITSHNGLIFIGTRLIVPNNKQLRENLFCLAHDNLGHFGGNKSYHALWNDFYWPNMWHDLINTYNSSCTECQPDKNRTSKSAGPLHPLPIPDKHFELVAIDFIGPLPKDDGFDAIVTMTNRLGHSAGPMQHEPHHRGICHNFFRQMVLREWLSSWTHHQPR